MKGIQDIGVAIYDGIEARLAITTETRDGREHTRVEVEVYHDGKLMAATVPYYRNERSESNDL